MTFTCKFEKIGLVKYCLVAVRQTPTRLYAREGAQLLVNSSKSSRSWTDALAKVHREGRCRVCGEARDLEAAHVIGRKHDAVVVGLRGGKSIYVHPDSVVPLCGAFTDNWCHGKYDGRELDLLPYLHLHEQVRAVEDAGGIVSALKRTSGGEYGP